MLGYGDRNAEWLWITFVYLNCSLIGNYAKDFRNVYAYIVINLCIVLVY